MDLRNDPYSEEQYQNLLRALHDAPLKPPPVGPKPVFEDVSVYQKSQPSSKPLVVPLRYGPSPPSAGKHKMGHHGVIVANHGEPAYDVSVSTPKIQIGTSELRFEGCKPVFTKADGDAFFVGTIALAPHYGTLGSGLFEEMRKFQVDEITVKLIYKDAENHWYETIGKIERDVSVAGGLSVRYVRQERTEQP